LWSCMSCSFFFRAEDCIRYFHVTGVQTCALPIWLGFGSKIVVTGDVTQVDLPNGQQSGLRVVQEILEGIDDIHFSRLDSRDVVRHKLVTEIVDAYNRHAEVKVPELTRDAAGRGPRKRGRQ